MASDIDELMTKKENPKSVKLENPTGKVVDVIESDVIKRHLFDAGFKLVKGEEYPKEIKDARAQYKARLKAQGIADGNDQSDPLQSHSIGDMERRAGSKGKIDKSEVDKNPAKTERQTVDVKHVDGTPHDRFDGQHDRGVNAPVIVDVDASNDGVASKEEAEQKNLALENADKVVVKDVDENGTTVDNKVVDADGKTVGDVIDENAAKKGDEDAATVTSTPKTGRAAKALNK